MVLLLVALPWPLLFVRRFGLEESIALVRATHPLSRQAPFYFYVIEIWGQFAPWSLLLPWLGIYVWRERSEIWHSGESLCLIWFVLLFLLLTIFQVRVSRYLLPALPPLALMLGGRWKKKVSYFFLCFMAIVLVWQIRELIWMRKDLSHSPGRVLTAEIKPVVEGASLHGYQLDISTLEELNFYFDPIVPLPPVKGLEGLSAGLEQGRKGWVLMPERVYKTLPGQESQSFTFIKKIPYKKERLVLVQTN
jgi:hypothetical protein